MFLAEASRHDRFKVGSHHAIDAKVLRHAVELVQVELAAAPSLFERLQGDVQADCVAEPETVRDRASEAVDAHGMPFKSMSLDALTKHRGRYPNDPQRRKAQAGYASAARDREPGLMGKLRPDLVESKRREQANDRCGYRCRGEDEAMVLRDVGGGESISPWSDPFQFSGARHTSEHFAMHAYSRRVTWRDNDSALTCKIEHPFTGALWEMCGSVYTHK